MEMSSEWIYYNHALIPKAAPHESVEVPKFDKKFWKNDGTGYPLFARWTSDFDSQTESKFWYIIKTGVYDRDLLSKKTRKHIRQAFKKIYVREILDNEVKELYSCYRMAYKRYNNADNFRSFESISEEFKSRQKNSMYYYGAFEIETNLLIGFFICTFHEDWLEINMSKYNPEFMKLRPSDALHDYVLNLWMNNPKIKYISSGSRNLNHETNVQEYKIQTFGFHKAYCTLHIKYRPCVYPVVKILYVFRHLLKKFDRVNLIHSINTILQMESIVRKQ